MRRPSGVVPFAAAVAALVTLASSVPAQQDPEAIRRSFLLTVPTRAPGGPSQFFRGAPGTNTGTPLAFGPGMGDFFVGFGYQANIRGIKLPNGTFTDNGDSDGSASFGFGLGNATTAIGFETVVTSLSTVRSGFFNRTAFSFQAYRNLKSNAAIAIGTENLFITDGSSDAGDATYYGVGSYIWQLKPDQMGGMAKAITLSGGVGNGRFRFIDDFNEDKKTINVFGSASVLFHEQISGIVDWTGQDLNVGVSFVPLKQFPVSITPALADLTGSASGSARFILSAGVGMHWDWNR